MLIYRCIYNSMQVKKMTKTENNYFKEISEELGYAVEPSMTLAEWCEAADSVWKEEWK